MTSAHTIRRRLHLFGTLLLFACGGSDDAENVDSPNNVLPRTTVATANLSGQIRVSLFPALSGGATLKQASLTTQAAEHPPACRKQVIGEGCVLQTCTDIESSTVDPTNIGRIDIRSDSRRTLLSPDATGYYQGQWAHFPLWTRSGEKISVEYMFRGRNVRTEQTAPARISLDRVARTASRGNPLSVSWKGAQPHDGGRIDISVGRI